MILEIYKSDDYLEFIRGKRCCACGKYPPNDPHHVEFKDSGMALRPSDTQAVPLCRKCHDRHDHVGSATFWKFHDIKVKIIKYQTEYISILEARKQK